MNTEGTDEKAVMKWLEPASLRASFEERAARLSIRVAGGDEVGDAAASVAFPVSAPGQNIELADSQGESIGMLRSLDGLDDESRRAIEAALRVRYLVPRVERVLELAEAAPSILRWRVVTDRGERAFFSESSREALRHQEPDRLRITDLAGNQYEIPAMGSLDPASRKLLEAVA